MTEYFSIEETQDADQRETALFGKLPAFLARVSEAAPGWAGHWRENDLPRVSNREALAALPVLRKSDLHKHQAENPPLGGFTMGETGEFSRIFMSPGPIFEPMGSQADPWNGARAVFAAGFRRNDIIHNSFAYHLTPGGFVLDTAARAMGCCVVAAGIGNTDQQIEAIHHLKPAGYTGTPDYLKTLLDRAAELEKDTSSLTRALVSGGALFPSLREEYRSRGIAVLQCYATADVGVIAYESEAMEGMILNEDIIVEIVRPGTDEPVADGEVGEVVVTTFNPVYPMIRFGTGDLSAIMPGQSPCGRSNKRIKGWMGRADQTTKIKGMFVHPSQVAQIAARHPELGRLRLEVSRRGDQDAMTLKAESPVEDDALIAAIGVSLRDICKLKGDVELVPPESLPNDGKVIADERDYDA